MDSDAIKPLGRWGKVGLVFFFVLLAAFGAHVEQKSAFLTRRMGDLDVFLRAAWAVRNDADLYAVTSDNDWHYLYPPLYAILMTPLADPPKGEDPTGYVPYPISVAIVYLLNVICMFLSAHVLASALEERLNWQTQPRFCLRWWALRLWPILACFLPIGHTMMRGQVNLIVLAVLCLAMAGWIRQQTFRAGLWLALAICIKVIPVYLLIYPIWKRDGRALTGCLVGCVAGLLLVPVLVFGPARMLTTYETYAKAFLGPMLNATDDERSREEIATTDAIGVKNALHNWIYPAPARYTQEMHPVAKSVYILLGLAMTWLTLRPVRRLKGTALHDAYPLACLILLMAIFSPVNHMHYLLFCMPCVMCLLANSWRDGAPVRVSIPLMVCFFLFNATMIVSYLPDMERLRDTCISMFASLPFWAIPVVQMWRTQASAPAETAPRESRQAA